MFVRMDAEKLVTDGLRLELEASAGQRKLVVLGQSGGASGGDEKSDEAFVLDAISARPVVLEHLEMNRLDTLRVDQHGRYVCHLFTSPSDVPTLDCFTSGTHLNAALLAAGHGLYKKKYN